MMESSMDSVLPSARAMMMTDTSWLSRADAGQTARSARNQSMIPPQRSTLIEEPDEEDVIEEVVEEEGAELAEGEGEGEMHVLDEAGVPKKVN
jgi:hypothetical protein